MGAGYRLASVLAFYHGKRPVQARPRPEAIPNRAARAVAACAPPKAASAGGPRGPSKNDQEAFPVRECGVIRGRTRLPGLRKTFLMSEATSRYRPALAGLSSGGMSLAGAYRHNLRP